MKRKAEPLGTPSTKLPCVHSTRRVLVLLLAVGTAMGSELIHFKNGFSLEAVSHVIRGSLIEAKCGAGTLEFSASEVGSYETIAEPAAAVQSISAPMPITPELLLSRAALSQGMDDALVRSLALIESGLKQASISPKGAIGLMQLMPATAKSLGVDANLAEENVRGGVQYLRSLLIRYRGDSALALAAYNAGPGAVRRFKGVPPFLETRKYVVLVLKEYERQLRLQKLGMKGKVAGLKAANKPSATD